jgi:hypothetical protein
MEVKTIYVANDGKEFSSKAECSDYEKTLRVLLLCLLTQVRRLIV